jgi:hypothetical protein
MFNPGDKVKIRKNGWQGRVIEVSPAAYLTVKILAGKPRLVGKEYVFHTNELAAA